MKRTRSRRWMWPMVVALLLLGIEACVAKARSTAPAPTPSPVAVNSPTIAPPARSTRSPSPTPRPTATRRPSPTPRPTPTLPTGPDFACIPPDAPRVAARVLQVYDGDTIAVKIGFQVYRVRYEGIDTPETKRRGDEPAHPWGLPAKRRNQELVSGKVVTLVRDPNAEDRDHYGRLLRYVIVDDVFVNYQLLKEGLAWYYVTDHACGPQFLAAEAEARAARRGLWSGATPTPFAPR